MIPMSKSNLNTQEQVATIWELGGFTVKELTRRLVSGIDDDNLLAADIQN